MWGALYPGQGSQYPGMGKYLYDNFTLVKRLFEEASDTLNFSFSKLCFDGPESELALTENTQPALYLVSIASYAVLKEISGFAPKAYAGHSIGEYGAVVSAGALGFIDALQAVRKRGQAMQAAVPLGQGGMVAVMGLSPEQVTHLCKWSMENSNTGPLEPANFNAPGQIVISGSQKTINWLKENIRPDIFNSAPKKMRLIPLKVSAPFHCSMMTPATEEMKTVLGEMTFSDIKVPVVQNKPAKPVFSGNEIRENLISQIEAPVRWVECVEELKRLGIQNFVEVGCGNVLSGLVKKIDSENLKTFNMNSMEDIQVIERELN